MTRRLLLRIATIALCARAFAGDPPSEPILRLETGSHTAVVRAVAADAQGRFFLSASDDKTARLWDGQGGLVRVLRVPMAEGNEGRLYACALSPDGSIAALGGWTGWDFDGRASIYLFDRESGELLRRLPDQASAIKHLAFSRDGSLLACTLGTQGLRIFDTRSWKELYADSAYATESYGVAFSGDGRYVAASCYDGMLRLYRLGQPGLVGKVKTRGGTQPHGVSFSPDGRMLACGFNDTAKVDVYAVSDAGLSFSFSPDLAGATNGNLCVTAFSADGLSLAAGGTWASGNQRLVRLWSDAGRGTYRNLDVGASDTIMDLETLRDGSLLAGGAGPALSRVASNGRTLFRVRSEVPDYRALGDGLRLSHDAKVFAFAYEVWGARPASFSVPDRVISDPPPELLPPSVGSLQVTEWNGTTGPKLDGKALPLKPYEVSFSLAIGPGASRFLLGTGWYLRCFDAHGVPLWDRPTPGVAWAVNVSGDGRIGVAACGDGTLRFHRMADGEELLALFPHPDGRRWILFTPSGYYDASAGAEDLLGWHVNNGKDRAPDFYSVSRFRGRFYRPDVVSLVLDTLDVDVALARADEEAGRKAQASTVREVAPPVVTIVHPDSGVEVSATTLTVKYIIRTPSGEPVSALRVLVDGRPSGAARGLSVTPAEGGVYSVDVELPERDAVVSLIAENRYAASEPSSIRTVWKGRPEEFVSKPKLYLLAVGVSAYQKSSLRLGYAAKDAQDFARAAASQQGKLYREVESRVLVDAAATKDDILDGLEWIQLSTTARDVAMVFMAGHGVNDANGVYYYLPVDADPERLKRSCLPFTDVQTTVRAIAGKALFFIDTCHAGNILGSDSRRGASDINAVVNELSSVENGAVVFAASTGNQYSVERPEWENGAFTKALVEALSGKADYTGTGRITVNMIDLYLSERVKELTGGTQTPTTAKPPSVPDFPVAVR